jgi:hypothetical protein
MDDDFFVNARIVRILVLTKMSTTLSFRPSPWMANASVLGEIKWPTTYLRHVRVQYRYRATVSSIQGKQEKAFMKHQRSGKGVAQICTIAQMTHEASKRHRCAQDGASCFASVSLFILIVTTILPMISLTGILASYVVRSHLYDEGC